MTKSPVEMIEIIAEGLDYLLSKVVFVGGAVTSLYYDDPAAQKIRPTKDVDFIIEIYSNSEYSQLEEELRKQGFGHDISPGAPICRKIYKNIIVDVMPTNESILGFVNRWHSDSIRKAEITTLPSGQEINILPLTYFIASKIDAFKQRGNQDYLFSHDIEDVISVLDGRIELAILNNADNDVKKYLKEQFSIMIRDNRFIESIQGHIGYDSTSSTRAFRIIDFIKEFTAN